MLNGDSCAHSAQNGAVEAVGKPGNGPVSISTDDAEHDSRPASSKAFCHRNHFVRRVSSIDADEPYHYSGQCVSVKARAYEYWDSPSALIGHGSYGIVFRGVDRMRGNANVAVKKMARVNVKQGELAAMKSVRSAHLVSLIDVCDEEGDLTYLVMELCDNDLDRHLRRCAADGRLEAGELRAVTESIAKGYYALYQQRIVHRDIKPQNILVVYNRLDGRITTAKITDFGVSRILTDGAKDGDEGGGLCSVVGTVLYMAPEVGANLLITSQYDSAADMWSIGCVLYQALTGKLPFDEQSLCRLFLYCAGGNFDAYEAPSLPEETHHDLKLLIYSLLEIDAHKRATPSQLHAVVASHLLSPTNYSKEHADESHHSLNEAVIAGFSARRLLAVKEGHGKSL